MDVIRRRLLVTVALVALASVFLVSSGASAAPVLGNVVGVVPVSGTPHVLDGRVNSITRAAGQIVLGGSFSSARDEDSTEAVPRANLLAFDETTHRLSTTFLATTDGPVSVVLAAPDGQSVYVGGSFTTVNGQPAKNLARVRVSDGSLVTTFNPATVSGPVKDLKLAGGRLWVGGAFTHIANRKQLGLATINPETGSFLTFMRGVIAGTHNGGYSTVMKFDINPAGTRLVAIGNFDTYDGVKNHQLFMLDLTGVTATLAPFQTAVYETPCASAFDTYMRDLDFSPDGSFFVVSTTGAYGGQAVACDTTARFETGATGTGVGPSWVDHTGGDTTYAVEITDSIVYTGGHARWQNNSFAGDRAGQGAVARPGIAALDPVNGLPLSWNPTRERGVGVFDFLVTSAGLWVASDTDRIGDFYLRSRIALMPTAGGTAYPIAKTPTLPNNVYLAGTTGVARKWGDGTAFGASSSVPSAGITWADVKGAFMLNGWLYAAWSDGTFNRRQFDGSTFGAPEPVNTQDQLTQLTDWRTDIQSMTGMFYDNGRIYFTRSGNTSLLYRYFTPESKVVGARRLTASTNVDSFVPSQVRSMFVSGDSLYFGDSLGNLRRIGWSRTAAAGVPVGPGALVGGPAVDGQNWSARAYFLYQDADGDNAFPAPTAEFSSSCVSRACTFDAGASQGNGGTITSYAWSFGDGTTGSGMTPSKTYSADGTYHVTLTVTTNKGQTATITNQVQVSRINELPVAAFSFTCEALSCGFNGQASTDPDGTVTDHVWDFGDETTGAGPTPEHIFPGPGTYAVSLTVTDNDGGTGSLTRSVTVNSVTVDFVAGASTNGNRTAHPVTIPASVQAGDSLVLFFSGNSSAAAPATPVGWNLLKQTDAGGLVGYAWTKTATAADAGSVVNLSTSGFVKSDVSIAAYRGTGGSVAVADSAAAARTSSASALTTPPVNSGGSGSWLVSYWAAKASTALTITGPAGNPARTGSQGTGSGAVTALLADSGAAVATGTSGSLTANLSSAATRGAMFSIVVAPS